MLIANYFIRPEEEEKKKTREIFIRIMTVITIRYLLPDRARPGGEISARSEKHVGTPRIFSPQRARPFLIPSCRVLNSPLLLLLLAHTSRFSNYARVAYLTDGICPSLLLCSFLREPSPLPLGSSCPFKLGRRKAGPVRSETLRLCSRAIMAIKRRPITIVIVIVITVVISKSERVLRISRSSSQQNQP